MSRIDIDDKYKLNNTKKLAKISMAGISYSSLRAGQKYWMTNYGDRYEFEILEVLPPEDFKLKDLNTLESYLMSDLTRYGKGGDFEIRELY